ncbi:MAG: DUF86 domain-containing protein [Eubacteriales bacterium]
MPDIEVAVDKLLKMEQYVNQLDSIKPASMDEYKKDLKTKYAVERIIQMIVDLAVDVNNVLLSYCKKPPAADYFNSFIELSESGVLEKTFALKIAPSTGLRNRLVHEYEKINDEIVYNSFQEVIVMYNQYIKEINRFIRLES